MKKTIVSIFVALLSGTMFVNAEESTSTVEDFENYHRSSLSMITVVHPADSFSNEIKQAVVAMPFPEKYDKHDLGFTFVEGTPHADRKADLTSELDIFMQKQQVAKRMVASWFGFDGKSFNLDLIRERGQYDASVEDAQMALQTVRGKAMLDDAGEELLGKTFFLVNDISYIDHKQRAEIASEGARVTGEAAEAVGDAAGEILGLFGGIGKSIGGLVKATGSLAKTGGDLVAGVTDLLNISGFVVRINTYLYQLEWNDSIASVFYEKYYTMGVDSLEDSAKVAAFLADTTTFKMKFVGKHDQLTDKGTLYSKKSQEEQMLVTCTRTLDKNIVNLQRKYPDFQVKVPIYEVVYNEKGKVEGCRAHVGLKEGITEKTKFSLLEKSISDDGRTVYKKVGTLKPVKGQICDNRYMAAEELMETGDAGAAALQGTLLKGSKKVMPGMLIMEGDYKEK